MATKRSTKTTTDNEQSEPKEINQRVKPNNHLKMRIDDLKVIEPLTANQKLFFDVYKRGDYFIALHGAAGTGKCQGEDVEVNLLVSEEIYEKLINMS